MTDRQVNVRTVRQGPRRILLHEPMELDVVLRTLETPGEPLCVSRKRSVVRVGNYVVKSRTRTGRLGVLTQTVRRRRYRRCWKTALRMLEQGVPVAMPRSFVETGTLGMIRNFVYICDYLSDSWDTVSYLENVLGIDCADETRITYFSALAQAMRKLEAAGIYAHDLKHTNILTRNGRDFVLVDLDDTDIGLRYTEARRFKNHYHLYRDFRRFYEPEELAPLIDPLLPRNQPLAPWLRRLESEYRMWIASKA